MSRSSTDLVAENEKLQQKIHDLQRSLKTTKMTQEDLVSELDSIQATKESEKATLIQHHVQEMEKLRDIVLDLRFQNTNLESRCEAYEKDLQDLRDSIKTLESLQIKGNANLNKKTQLERELETRIAELTSLVDEMKDDLSRLNTENLELRRVQEVAQEKIECLEETLQSKKEEMAAKQEIIDNLQESLHNATSELMQLQRGGIEEEKHDQKGNSLFAEVHDQREKVVSILNSQNKSYKQMKEAYRQSQSEIRRLKSENAVMVAEIEKVKTIFLNADVRHKEQLCQRNTELLRDSEKWQKKIRFLESQLEESNVGMFLEYCRNETAIMKTELMQCRMQKCELSEALQLSQEELARCRFQCLKQKCILIDREMKLEENKIEFEPRNLVPVTESVQLDDEEELIPQVKIEIPDDNESDDDSSSIEIISEEIPLDVKVEANLPVSSPESDCPDKVEPISIEIEQQKSQISPEKSVNPTLNRTQEFERSPPKQSSHDAEEKENLNHLNHHQKPILVKQRLTKFMDNKHVQFSPDVPEIQTSNIKQEPLQAPLSRAKPKCVVKQIIIKSRKPEK